MQESGSQITNDLFFQYFDISFSYQCNLFSISVISGSLSGLLSVTPPARRRGLAISERKYMMMVSGGFASEAAAAHGSATPVRRDGPP